MPYTNLIEGCKANHQQSQELLVRRLAPKLLAVCERYCMEKNLAQDALQETFIALFKYIHTYTGEGNFEGWAKKIAVRCSLKLNATYKRVLYVETPQLYINDNTFIPEVYGSLSIEAIMQLLKKLSDSQYVIFNMFVIEGFSHKEISETLNIPESTSRSLLARGRVRLMELIREQEKPSGNTFFQLSYLFN